MTNSKRSPFIYGRPVRADEFLGREAGLGTIFSRLRNGESTAIIGGPDMGKSSLLLKVADEATQRDYLGDDARCLIISQMDLQPIGSDYAPADFWEEALEPLQERPGHRTTSQQLKRVAETGYARRSLERLFNNLGRQDRWLVLLLDEFERLLIHPHFQDPAFFALLRSLATRTGGLALVVASRLSVAEMNERGRGLLETGSPFFNNIIESRLRPFDRRAVDALLDRAGEALSRDDRCFVCRVAGHHPLLLQAMAAAMVEISGADRHARAAKCFYGRISFHFDLLWHAMDDRTRATMAVLSLLELGTRALGPGFFAEIEQIDAFGAQLWNLSAGELVERVGEDGPFDREHLYTWGGECWSVREQAFTWWLRDKVLSGPSSVPQARAPRPVHNRLAELRGLLTTRFNEEELRSLVFGMGIEYDVLPGSGTAGKARELVGYLDRRGRIHELVRAGKELRPDVPWDDWIESSAHSSRESPAWEEWLANEGYRFLLTREQWDRLVGAVCSPSALRALDIGEMARLMLKELSRDLS